MARLIEVHDGGSVEGVAYENSKLRSRLIFDAVSPNIGLVN